MWATKELPARKADEGFYRISGVKGSGKTHLTKLFILDVLREVESNPYAKLVVYEPKRQFYAWMCSLGIKSQINYLMPSDVRSVALDFVKDYATDQDSLTLASAFYPIDSNEKQRFWGDALRTIYAQVYVAIKNLFGYADLRLMCLVLEDEALTRAVLKSDPYLVQAMKLVEDHGDAVGETKQNIQMTIHSRIAEMKVLAAHFEEARKDNGLFSLRDFIKHPASGVLVVSKDSDYGLTQDPLNGVVFLRLTQLLDKEQVDPRRKVFIVIDEFPTLAGDKPCPGITDMFLRLRDRGVTVLITYQAHITFKRIYGETAAENLGQCTNVIYLRQSDVESAEAAAEDLGRERGYEPVNAASYGGGRSGNEESSNWSVSRNMVWYDRPIHSATELLNHLQPADKSRGIEGRAKSPEGGPKPWSFTYHQDDIERIPKRHTDIQEYIERDPDFQRISQLEESEKTQLKGLTAEQAEEAANAKYLD